MIAESATAPDPSRATGYPVMGQYLHALDGCPAPRVLVDHDASLRDHRAWRGPLGGLTGTLDARAWRRFERAVLRQVGAAVVHTERDRLALEGLASGTPIIEIALATAIHPAPLDVSGGSPAGVLFVGSFTHPPNVDAALWLGSTIFPPLHAVGRGKRAIRCDRARRQADLRVGKDTALAHAGAGPQAIARFLTRKYAALVSEYVPVRVMARWTSCFPVAA